MIEYFYILTTVDGGFLDRKYTTTTGTIEVRESENKEQVYEAILNTLNIKDTPIIMHFTLMENA